MKIRMMCNKNLEYVKLLEGVIDSVDEITKNTFELSSLKKSFILIYQKREKRKKLISSKKTGDIEELFELNEEYKECKNKIKKTKLKRSYLVIKVFFVLLSLIKEQIKVGEMPSAVIDILKKLFYHTLSIVKNSDFELEYDFSPIIPLLTGIKIKLEELDLKEHIELKRCVDSLYNLIFEEDESE